MLLTQQDFWEAACRLIFPRPSMCEYCVPEAALRLEFGRAITGHVERAVFPRAVLSLTRPMLRPLETAHGSLQIQWYTIRTCAGTMFHALLCKTRHYMLRHCCKPQTQKKMAAWLLWRENSQLLLNRIPVVIPVVTSVVILIVIWVFYVFFRGVISEWLKHSFNIQFHCRMSNSICCSCHNFRNTEETSVFFPLGQCRRHSTLRSLVDCGDASFFRLNGFLFSLDASISQYGRSLIFD